MRLYFAGLLGWGLLMALLVAQVPHQHDNDPAGSTEKDRCRSTCHQKHCDQWRDCNYSVTAGPDLEACHKRVEENETQCQKTCEEPKA